MSLNELNLLRQLLPSLKQNGSVKIPPGDDCAAVDCGGGKWLLLAVDQLIENVHYLDSVTTPEQAGAKLMNRNLSDIAAMGGIPRWALLTIAGGGKSEDWLLKFSRGAAQAGERWQTPIVGGDLSSQPGAGMTATLTIVGEVESNLAIRRSGARLGDVLMVTGRLGGSFASGRHLTFQPRLEEGRFLRNYASAMMDISDGLLLDLSRLTAASGVGAQLETVRLPRHENADIAAALSDGEDYELLFTVHPGKVAELLEKWPSGLAPLQIIGNIIPERRIIDEQGNDLLNNRRIGYEH